MSIDDTLRIINTLLNLVAIPALWVLLGIKTSLTSLSERLGALKDRVDRMDDRGRPK